MVQILIVEDDPNIASFLARGLAAEGYVTTTARSATEARRWTATLGAELNLVLLDLGLPDEDGTTLLQSLRAEGFSAPVIVLTAKDGLAHKVAGLDAGANDYITKPFAFDELLARIRAVRRNVAQPSPTEIVVGDLTLHVSRPGNRLGARHRRLSIHPGLF